MPAPVQVVVKPGKMPVIASASIYKKMERLDIRHYYTSKSGEMIPTDKGVNVAMAEIDAMIEAIKAAGEKREGEHIVDAGQTVHVYINDWQGQEVLHVRHFYMKKDGTEAPSKAGVYLPADYWRNLIQCLKTVKSSWNNVVSVAEIGDRVSQIEV